MRKGKDPNKKPPTKRQKIIWTSFIAICVLMIAVMICGVFGLKKAKLFKDDAKEVKYEKFLEMVDDKKVKDIKWSEDEETITFSDKKDKSYTTANPKYERNHRHLHGTDRACNCSMQGMQYLAAYHPDPRRHRRCPVKLYGTPMPESRNRRACLSWTL